ncbi:anion transporter [Schlesneria paludicola]|uniref:anion transporter n=1 Tax=Schlesneria paludicola TaxID=360056 RepID=UPI00029A4050|nr:anion transporter [Schlesneria paludicola]
MDTITAVRLTSVIFGLTYIALAIGKIPRLRVDRAGIALIGAVIMLAVGLIDLKAAAEAIDFETIALLFGMMVLVAYLQIGGFFQVATDRILQLRLGAFGLLAMTMSVSGVFSAFLVNDVVCVALTPLILDLCRRTKQPMMPHLIGLATASNVGSVATITGNPQNMIIGSLSEISYLRFVGRLAPIAILGLVVNFLIVACVYRRSLSSAGRVEVADDPAEAKPIDRVLLMKGSIVTIGVVALFFLGSPIAVVALVAAAIMMLSTIDPSHVYRRVDWPLLLMFAGLFIIVDVFNTHVVRGWAIEDWTFVTTSPVIAVSGLSVVLSNLVSNVPAVLLFKPIVPATTNPEQAWLALAMSSTFAGNLTVLGSVANLIVVENARRAGFNVSFQEYLKVGIPVTIITTLLGVGWLQWTHY